MTNYDAITYKKHFLKQVVCRIDFMGFLSSEIISDQDLTMEIKSHFERKQSEQIIRYKLADTAEAKAAGHEVLADGLVEGLQLNYVDTNDNKLIISNKYLILDYKTYDTYENFINSFRKVIDNIFSRNKIISARVGLRYVNIYNTNSIKIKKVFFEKDVANNTQLKQFEYGENLKLIRSMQLTEYIFENCRLNFRYGLYNPTYPSQLRTLDYVLDFDCYTNDPLKQPDEIILQIKKEHDGIQSIFEQSITDKLRSEMKNE